MRNSIIAVKGLLILKKIISKIVINTHFRWHVGIKVKML